MTSNMFPKLVLFDLDGTLLDSAPDMLATVNHMRAARGQGLRTLRRAGLEKVAQGLTTIEEVLSVLPPAE